MSTMPGHLAHTDRPERSRNAKAQARHRAKRKAYIEQLEHTVTKLQQTVGFSTEDIEAMPPPLARIRELELENSRLERENEELRRLMLDNGRPLPIEFMKRTSPSGPHDHRSYDSQLKRRKMVNTVESAYASPSETPPHSVEHSVRPPQLSITTSINQYPYGSSTNSANSLPPSSTLYTLQAPAAFNMGPNTPSGSSATSSPPFSPAQMQESIHSPANHRPSSNHAMLSSYSQRPHYGNVKVEEDHHYAPQNHHSHGGHYAVTQSNDSYTHGHAGHNMDWQYRHLSR